MIDQIAVIPPSAFPLPALPIPALFAEAGESVAERFIEFFTAEHRNANTRAAYAQAVRQFASWSRTCLAPSGGNGKGLAE